MRHNDNHGRAAALALGAAALALAACGGGHARTAASSLASNPAVQADRARAMAIITPCLPANQLALLKKAGRTAFIDCVVPDDPAKRAAFEQCLSGAATADHVLTRAGRLQFLEGADARRPSVIGCVTRFAAKPAATVLPGSGSAAPHPTTKPAPRPTRSGS